MAKTLLIISGGIEACPGIRLAKEMGLHVVVSDMNPSAPGLMLADDCIIASTYDVEATVAACRKYHQTTRPIDGVICIASDVPLTVASVAAALGLPAIPIESARLATDKLAMKRRFSEDGVPVPWFSPVESVDRLRQIAKEPGYPLVLKPVDSRGARGVLLLIGDLDLEVAYNLSLRQSPTGQLLVEQFLPGPQISTESIVLDGVAYTPGFADRNYEFLERYAPHIIENGGELPSRLPPNVQQSIRDLVSRAAASLGIRNGVVKGDIVVPNGKPHMIEMAARLSGGYLCTHEIPLNTGVNFVGAAIRQALGETIDPAELTPRFRRAVVQRCIFPQPGRVVRICGVESAWQSPGVEEVIIHVRPGDVLRRPTDSNASAGIVITCAETHDEAERRARQAVQAITIETEAA